MDADGPDDLDPEKARSALELLEAEKQRRIDEKVAAGLVRVVGHDPGETLVVGSEEMIEEAVQRAEAEALNKYGNNPPLHCDFLVIVTGVVRAGERYSPDAVPSSPRLSEETPPQVEPIAEPVELEPGYCAPPQPPAYLYVTIRQATDASLGQILDGFYEVTNGELVLSDTEHQLISSRRLKEGEEPLDVAREMLRKTVNVDQLSFTRDIRYPKRGVA